MAGQTKFYKFVTAFSSYRGLFINRPSIINCTQVAAIRLQSREKLRNLPEKPKKPMIPFFLFAQARREELRKANPNAKITDIAKMLANEWKKVDDSVKQQYETQYKKAMNDYLRKYLEYNAALTEEQKNIMNEIVIEKKKDKEQKKIRKTLKEANKPKGPRGPFIYFLLEYYGKNKANFGTYSEFLKKSKPIWESLSDGEKQKFHDMYLDDKKRYELEMEEWEAKMIKAGHTDLVRRNTLAANNIPKRPIKPKASTDNDSHQLKSSKAEKKTSDDNNPKQSKTGISE